MLLKRCPTCNRTFSDEAISFCLVDGSILSAPYDPQATLVLDTTQLPTIESIDISTGQPNLSSKSNNPSVPKQETYSKAKWHWVILASILSVIVLLGIYIYVKSIIGKTVVTNIFLTYGLLSFGSGYILSQHKWKLRICLSLPPLIFLLIMVIKTFKHGGPPWELDSIVILTTLILLIMILSLYWGALFASYRQYNRLSNHVHR